MAATVSVTSRNCLCWSLVLLLVISVCTSVSGVDIQLPVPHTAHPGYLIVNLGCEIDSLFIETNGLESKEFNDTFMLTPKGDLVVNGDISQKIGKTFSFTVDSEFRCFDNTPLKRHYTISISNSPEVHEFGERKYEGIIFSPDEPESSVVGLDGISVCSKSGSLKLGSTSFSIIGVMSEMLSIRVRKSDVDGCHLLSIGLKSSGIPNGMLEISPKFSFLLESRHDFQVKGFTNLHIILNPSNSEGSHLRDRPIPKTSDNFADTRQTHEFVSSFDKSSSASENAIEDLHKIQMQDELDMIVREVQEQNHRILNRRENQDVVIHRRVRRQSTLTYTVPEDKSGVLFTADSGVSAGTVHSFALISATPENIFLIGQQSGEVTVRPNDELDYEEGPGEYTLTIEVRAADGTTVLNTKSYTLRITNVNDEVPTFTTQPVPYLAVIAEDAIAGTSVFQLTAVDPDGSTVYYFVDSGSSTFFEVNRDNGIITSNQIITGGDEFTVRVYAIDADAQGTQQRTNTVDVNVKRGMRAPQFYATAYIAYVLENKPDNEKFKTYGPSGQEVKVQAINFQAGGSTSYKVLDATLLTDARKFAIANGDLEARQSFDYEQDSHVQRYVVEARDSLSQLYSRVNLTVYLMNINEYGPMFGKSTYVAQNVPENLPLGSVVVNVSATDQDSNSNITFTVSNPLFSVDSQKTNDGSMGFIRVNGELDYDKTAGQTYEFTVTAIDNEVNPKPLSANATVVVYMANVNDNPPVFEDDTLTTTVNEDIPAGSTLIIVRAVDDDGDGISYYFEGRSNRVSIFEIETTSGKISLTPGQSIPKGSDKVDTYSLGVIAVDDGKCCGDNTSRTTKATVTINIIDAVNNKPVFTVCEDAEVKENEPENTIVTTVLAEDSGRGDNGKVEYYLQPDSSPTGPYFKVNKTTGVITTTQQMDREALTTRKMFVTIKALDKGQPPQDAFCSLEVNVKDVNDNAPVFENSYQVTVLGSTPVGSSIITINADDKDLGENSDLNYSLITNPSNLFSINDKTGEIRLQNAFPQDGKTYYTLTVQAIDNGVPPLSSTVQFNITITSETSQLAPVWNETNVAIYVPESTDVDTCVKNLTATSRNPQDSTVVFSLIDNNQASDRTEYIFLKPTGNNAVCLTIYKELNYEKDPVLTLRLRANIPPPASEYADLIVTINVEDSNDQVPQFLNIDLYYGTIGLSVSEGEPPGSQVAGVSATDADIKYPFNKVTYEMNDPYFSINPETGMIYTNATFDREMKESYSFQVKAIDGALSSRPGATTNNTGLATVSVTIKDVNDNSPWFPQSVYRATVNEDVFIGTSVIAVIAEDLDTGPLTYSLTGSSLFDVRAQTGVIFVAGYLDYEKGDTNFSLVLTVNDGIYSNTTTVIIQVNDTNDNLPVFSEATYEINNITENRAYSGAILKVSATDPDTLRNKGVEYFIAQDDQLINEKFKINNNTGDIFLSGTLDRDKPQGRNIYQFVVLAVDEPGSPLRLTGYATVVVIVIDVNDNAPLFVESSLEASVPEMSDVGTLVTSVTAIDYDDGKNAEVTYSLKPNTQTPAQPNPAFSVSSSGEIRVANSNIDRETNSMYTLEIIATDGGTPPMFSSATATINIKDINDNKPFFSQEIYKFSIPEDKTGRIAVLSVTDADSDDIHRCTLVSGTQFFSVLSTGRDCSLSVYTRPDYEKPDERFFNLTIQVKDGIESHTDTAYVEITVLDVNDESPIFNPSSREVNVSESAPVGTYLTTFVATDRDGGINGEMDYFISGKPVNETPSWYFQINSTGAVSIRNKLDRETIPTYQVKILAIDKGSPPLTGTANLKVTVNDVNDEYPRFRGNPRPVLPENSGPIQRQVVVLYGADPDGSPYGAPFTFDLRCPPSQYCDKFSLQFDSQGDNGNGIGIVSTNKNFDREQQQFYELSIIMTDMRDHPQQGSLGLTATNTLTIEIGDVNDNPMAGGTQTILVYQYNGLFKYIAIGSVNFIDPDDDVQDKEFTMVTSYASNFFNVSKSGGVITMLDHVLEGEYRFNVVIRDTVRPQEPVTSTVIITVEDLPEEAPYVSGSIRLTGTTPQDFISPGQNGVVPYDAFRTLLAQKLNVLKGNIQVINVQPSVIGRVDYTDVRYSAHGSPYYSPSKLNSIVTENKNEFAAAVQADIAMVGIDECLRETCESGGCFNKLTVYPEPSVVNTRGNSVVGVRTTLEAECGCPVTTNVTQCVPGYCYHGKECKQDYFGVLTCDCQNQYDGPRCQHTKLGFNGNGYAVFKTLQQCENSLTSIEFITSQADGLILYNGPIQPLQPRDPTDFIALQLINGYPQLLIDHGTGPLVLDLDGKNLSGTTVMGPLNDGNWHHIDIRRQGKLVTMTVDYCMAANNVEGTPQDRLACETSRYTPGENFYLNVYTPLQLGGKHTSPYSTITSWNFNGCMRNLRHNGELYDLETNNFFNGVSDSCGAEDEACNRNSINLTPKCEPNGICQLTALGPPPTAICVCNPGYRGSNCETTTTIQEFGDQSFMAWELQSAFNSFLSNMEMDIQLQYRTRDTNGILYHVTGTGLGEFVKLEIVDDKLQVLYNLGDNNQILSLSHISAADAQWHTVYLRRRGSYIILSRDGQEGLEFADSYSDSTHQELAVKGDQIYAGAEVSYEHSVNIDADNPKDLTLSCLNDIRLQGRWFPMTASESANNSEVKLEQQINVVVSDCVRDACNTANVLVCSTQGKECMSVWGEFICVCPKHQIESGSICQYIDYCQQQPCHYRATCKNNYTNIYGYTCICPVGLTGRLCNEGGQVVPPSDDDAVIWPIILACVLAIVVIAIIVGALIYVCGRRRTNDDEAMLDNDKEDYDIRENIVDYDEEGAGEEDHEGYDITGLRKPAEISRMDRPELMSEKPLRSAAPGEGHIGDFINDRLYDTDQDPSAPPHDTLIPFGSEGGGSDAGSLSSLNTSTTDASQDYDYLNEWGPKFAKLADMYNNYDESE